MSPVVPDRLVSTVSLLPRVESRVILMLRITDSVAQSEDSGRASQPSLCLPCFSLGVSLPEVWDIMAMKEREMLGVAKCSLGDQG